MIPVFLIVVRANLPAREVEPEPPARDLLAEGVRRIKKLEQRESDLVNQVKKHSLGLALSTIEMDSELEGKIHKAGEHLRIYHAHNFALYAALISGRLAEFEKYLAEAKHELDRYERILKELADETKKAGSCSLLIEQNT